MNWEVRTMRSATSYFNGTLYRKTMARFWPLWGMYGLFWLFLIPLNMLNEYFSRYLDSEPARRLLGIASSLPDLLVIGVYIAAFFALLCAMAVFGYLYQSRSACWTHALPTRREALFTTQYLAGLSFLLLPQLAAAVLAAIVELALLPMDSWGLVLGRLGVWLLAQSGLCLFFFSFAAFCAMFTGHILALPAFYVILNALASVIASLLEGLFYEFFFGFDGFPRMLQAAAYLTPTEALRDACGWWYNGGDRPYLASPATLAVYAAVGVLLALASLYVYRRRHVETAGDVVAVPLVRPLFKYGVSFCSGLCIGMLTAAFFGWSRLPALIPCILVWTVAGYFAAEMLLKKSFRVFRAWKGGAAMAAVMLLLSIVCSLDLMGVSARVPQADQVERLTVLVDLGYPGDSGQQLTLDLSGPAEIQRFVELHQAVVDDRDRLDRDSSRYEAGNDYANLQLVYTLKNGSSLSRHYGSLPLYREELETRGSVTALFQDICRDRGLVRQAYGFDSFLEGRRLTGAWLDRVRDGHGDLCHGVYVDDYAKRLWDAVRQDFEEGTIGVRYLFDLDAERQANTYRTDLNFSSEDLRSSESYTYADGTVEYEPGYSETLSVTLTPQARHTLAVLEESGIWEEGYSLAERETDYDPRYPDTAAGGGSEAVY